MYFFRVVRLFFSTMSHIHIFSVEAIFAASAKSIVKEIPKCLIA